MKILLVEDDPEILGLLDLYLADRDCEVVKAADGVEAITEVVKAIKTYPFDLLVVDVAMRWIDGYSLAKAVRCFESNGLFDRKSRIMFHTGYHEAFSNQGLLQQTQVNKEDCFLKPDGTLKLMETLGELVRPK